MTRACVGRASLTDRLEGWAGGIAQRSAVASTITALASASVAVATFVRQHAIGVGDELVGTNADGDRQRRLDLVANDLIMEALADAPVAAVASEEQHGVVVLRHGAPLMVAVDPLDGSANLAINAPVGLIFSIRSAAAGGAAMPAFAAPGTDQVAAGMVVFGLSTTMLLTTGEGADLYELDDASRTFQLLRARVLIPGGTREFAINASNRRHWYPATRTFVEDLLKGEHGPRGADYNMRWYGALVADALRIVMRGGVFLYPADKRPGYQHGRLRLLYEAQPIAMLVEQAGGAATDGTRRILELTPTRLHQRTPLVFGSADKVARVARYMALATDFDGCPIDHSPLFGDRGLFRQ